MKKSLLLSSILLSLCAIPTFTLDESCDEAETRNLCFSNDCDDLCNSLALKDLCAKKIRAKQGLFREICAERIKSESICTRNLGVTEQVAINNVCAQNITTSDLCVTGTTRLRQICNPYGASVEFFADTAYTLGAPVNFDNVIDDPNGNVSIAPFSYTVPVGGYYAASIQVDARDLTGADVILGTPVSNIRLKINGIPARQSYLPFLTFNNGQRADLSFILFVRTGDIITVEYDVLIVGPAGTVPYVGTVTILGGADRTIFNIHYLASSCSPVDCVPCQPNPPCNLECTPLPNACIHRP